MRLVLFSLALNILKVNVGILHSVLSSWVHALSVCVCVCVKMTCLVSCPLTADQTEICF